MDAFLGHVLEDFKSGTITKDEAVSSLAHVIAAIDIGNYGEVVTWFEQGRKLIVCGQPSHLEELLIG